MKKFMLLLLLSVLSLNNLLSQTQSNQDYYDHLYYTCKVWGYAKYFHSEIAKTGGNWDEHLLTAISSLKNNVSNTEEFNNVLSELLKKAGTMELGIGTLPVKPEELKYNLETSWFDDSTLSTDNNSTLKDIKSKFRLQRNFYVSMYNSPILITDDKYYNQYTNSLPPENVRLLSLFRYWNIINYCFAYKNLLEYNWDEVLREFIPRFINCTTWKDYLFELKKISAKLGDSHSKTYSELNPETKYYFPFTLEYIEDQYVVTSVFAGRENIKVGDIILNIDGKEISELCEEISEFTSSSNISAKRRQACTNVICGIEEKVDIVVYNLYGINTHSINRNIPSNEFEKNVKFNKVGYKDRVPWTIIYQNERSYGYIDLGILEIEEIINMFTNLWDCDALIIDARNYPNSTLWDICPWLFNSPPINAHLQLFDQNFPGTFNWEENKIYRGEYSEDHHINFSKTWDKPITILFNQEAISQTEFSIMAYETHPKAVKIGSQTGGADGNVSKAYLPGGIISHFTGMGVFYPDKTPTQKIGIVPDYEVKPTIEGIRDGRDEVLNFALNYLNQSITSVKNVDNNVTDFSIEAYPNPFNPVTTIKYNLPNTENVKVEIYNSIGEKISTLINEEKTSGTYKVNFNAAKFSSGIYICRLSTLKKTVSKKLLLIK